MGEPLFRPAAQQSRLRRLEGEVCFAFSRRDRLFAGLAVALAAIVIAALATVTVELRVPARLIPATGSQWQLSLPTTADGQRFDRVQLGEVQIPLARSGAGDGMVVPLAGALPDHAVDVQAIADRSLAQVIVGAVR